MAEKLPESMMSRSNLSGRKVQVSWLHRSLSRILFASVSQRRTGPRKLSARRRTFGVADRKFVIPMRRECCRPEQRSRSDLRTSPSGFSTRCGKEFAHPPGHDRPRVAADFYRRVGVMSTSGPAPVGHSPGRGVKLAASSSTARRTGSRPSVGVWPVTMQTAPAKRSTTAWNMFQGRPPCS